MKTSPKSNRTSRHHRRIPNTWLLIAWGHFYLHKEGEMLLLVFYHFLRSLFVSLIKSTYAYGSWVISPCDQKIVRRWAKGGGISLPSFLKNPSSAFSITPIPLSLLEYLCFTFTKSPTFTDNLINLCLMK